MTAQHTGYNRTSRGGGTRRRTPPAPRQVRRDTNAAKLLDSLCILPPDPDESSNKSRFRPDFLEKAQIKPQTIAYVAAENSQLGFKNLAALNTLGQDVEPRHLDLLESKLAKRTKKLLSRDVGEDVLSALVEAHPKPAETKLETERRAVLKKAKTQLGFDNVGEFMRVFEIDENTFTKLLKGERHLTFNRILNLADEAPELTIAEVACFATQSERKLLLKLGENAKGASTPLGAQREEVLLAMLREAPELAEDIFGIAHYLRISEDELEEKIYGHGDFTREEVDKLYEKCPKLHPQFVGSLLAPDNIVPFLLEAHLKQKEQPKAGTSSRPKVKLPDWLEAYDNDLPSLIDARKQLVVRIIQEHFDSEKPALLDYLDVDNGTLNRALITNKRTSALKGSLLPETAKKLLELGISGRDVLILIAPKKWKHHLDLLSEDAPELK